MNDNVMTHIAFGRLSKSTGDQDRFVHDGTHAAYRVIVRGVPGGFDAGFSPYVVCRTDDGWEVRRFDNGGLVKGCTCYRTRAEAVRGLIDVDCFYRGVLWDMLGQVVSP